MAIDRLRRTSSGALEQALATAAQAGVPPATIIWALQDRDEWRVSKALAEKAASEAPVPPTVDPSAVADAPRVVAGTYRPTSEAVRATAASPPRGGAEPLGPAQAAFAETEAREASVSPPVDSSAVTDASRPAAGTNRAISEAVRATASSAHRAAATPQGPARTASAETAAREASVSPPVDSSAAVDASGPARKRRPTRDADHGTAASAHRPGVKTRGPARGAKGSVRQPKGHAPSPQAKPPPALSGVAFGLLSLLGAIFWFLALCWRFLVGALTAALRWMTS